MSEVPLDPDEVAEQLAGLYLVIGPLYRRVLRVVERDAPQNRMSVGIRAVLDQLRRHGPMTVPQIGRSQSLSRQFVQRMVNDARDTGFVELVDNPRNRRSHLVALTPAGRAAIADVIRREYAELRRVGGGTLTASDLTAAHRVLTAMLNTLDPVDDP